MKKYYRLKCLQNGNYMATGYNAESLADLCDQYASYKSNDWDAQELPDSDFKNMKDIWKELSEAEKVIFIKDDEFEIEESETPFPDQKL